MRPEVPLPEPSLRAVILRWLAPSTDTLARLLVIVSISPVPKMPCPVSYSQLVEDGAVLPAPRKSSVHTVDQFTVEVAELVEVAVAVLVGVFVGVFVGVLVAPPDPANTANSQSE